MISIIFQLLSTTPARMLASFARCRNAALVLIFSLASPAPPPPRLFQIDMSHCCRLALSLQSITVSYFSVFPASHGVWRLRGAQPCMEKERKGSEGERGSDLNS